MKDDIAIALRNAFLSNYHIDKSNAYINMSPCRFRPLTIQLATACRNYIQEDFLLEPNDQELFFYELLCEVLGEVFLI